MDHRDHHYRTRAEGDREGRVIKFYCSYTYSRLCTGVPFVPMIQTQICQARPKFKYTLITARYQTSSPLWCTRERCKYG